LELQSGMVGVFNNYFSPAVIPGLLYLHFGS
jgi:hypothetical protein